MITKKNNGMLKTSFTVRIKTDKVILSMSIMSARVGKLIIDLVNRMF